MKKLIFLSILILTACSNKSRYANAEATFKVWGNCEMCKDNIESALDLDGVRSAEWNENSKMLKVEYDSTKIKLINLHQKVAAAGYDTERIRANDHDYYVLPECCQYEREKGN